MYSFWGKSSDYIELEGWHWHVGWITLTINLQGLSVVCTRIYWMQFITLLYFLHHVTVIQTKLCKEIFEIENKCSSLKSWLYTLSPLESAVLSSKIHRMNKCGVSLLKMYTWMFPNERHISHPCMKSQCMNLTFFIVV